jgi:hypothetical protein
MMAEQMLHDPGHEELVMQESRNGDSEKLFRE